MATLIPGEQNMFQMPDVPVVTSPWPFPMNAGVHRMDSVAASPSILSALEFQNGRLTSGSTSRRAFSNLNRRMNKVLLTLVILGFLQKAKIGEIQYLCYGDECWYFC